MCGVVCECVCVCVCVLCVCVRWLCVCVESECGVCDESVCGMCVLSFGVVVCCAVSLCVVLVRNVWCVCCLCVTRLGTRKTSRVQVKNVSVCTFETPPCAPAIFARNNFLKCKPLNFSQYRFILIRKNKICTTHFCNHLRTIPLSLTKRCSRSSRVNSYE